VAVVGHLAGLGRLQEHWQVVAVHRQVVVVG
jgi:hypothetical protein